MRWSVEVLMTDKCPLRCVDDLLERKVTVVSKYGLGYKTGGLHDGLLAVEVGPSCLPIPKGIWADSLKVRRKTISKYHEHVLPAGTAFGLKPQHSR